jgi:hypothetical protein
MPSPLYASHSLPCSLLLPRLALGLHLGVPRIFYSHGGPLLVLRTLLAVTSSIIRFCISSVSHPLSSRRSCRLTSRLYGSTMACGKEP